MIRSKKTAELAIQSFLTALQKIRGAGKFCVQGGMAFAPPGIVLKNGNDLGLPLSAGQAAELRSLAEPAPYGMGTETRLDESVRKCWQIDASELHWTSAKWKLAVDALARKIARDLGVEGRVRAEPYKLLLYDKGGFFLPHRDTEKTPGMFGSLIICLPSRHAGGELVLRHQGREERVNFGAAFDPAELRFLVRKGKLAGPSPPRRRRRRACRRDRAPDRPLRRLAPSSACVGLLQACDQPSAAVHGRSGRRMPGNSARPA